MDYLKMKKVCGILVTPDDVEPQLLFMERAKGINPYPNMFNFVTGDIERGESIEDAVKRKVGEETGVDTSTCSFVKLGNFEYIDYKIKILFDCEVYMVYLPKKVDIKLNAEHTHAEWRGIKEVLTKLHSYNLTPVEKSILLKYSEKLVGAAYQLKLGISSYERHRVVCSVIVSYKENDPGLLLMERSKFDKVYAGMLNSVAGHVKAGEGYEEAMRRELVEEAGLTPDQYKLQRMGHFDFVDHELKIIFDCVTYIVYTPLNLPIRVSKEHNIANWGGLANVLRDIRPHNIIPLEKGIIMNYFERIVRVTYVARLGLPKCTVMKKVCGIIVNNLERESKVLLMKRTRTRHLYPNMLNFVTGSSADKELPDHTVKRLVDEQTGIEASSCDFIELGKFEYLDQDLLILFKIYVYFVRLKERTKLKHDAEHSDIKWYPARKVLNNLESYNLSPPEKSVLLKYS